MDANVIVGGVIPSALVTLGSGYWLFRHFSLMAEERRAMERRLVDLDVQRHEVMDELNNMRRPITSAEAQRVLDMTAQVQAAVRGDIDIVFEGYDSGPAPRPLAPGEPTLMEAWRD